MRDLQRGVFEIIKLVSRFMGSDKRQSDQTMPANCLPAFRWAGGKRRLLSQIVPLLPKKYNHYYEPFCGGAALFFHLRPSIATLGDKNEDLINCYRQVKNRCEDVIDVLQGFKNTKRNYYEIRKANPQDRVERAARFIYLVELSFNGLYRVNKDGNFNVPYGYKTKKKFDFDQIRYASKALADVKLVHGDFETTVAQAQAGDLIYFDPPYTVAHGNNGFVQYNEKIFSWDGQLRLARLANELADRGCIVVISNAEHSSIKSIYGNFTSHAVTRHSGIGAAAAARKHISEFVFTK